MSNITLSVDDETIRKVRKIAVDRGTTLTAMVREFLALLASRDEPGRARAAKELDRSFAKLGREMGRHTWIREDLHER